jgi:uncharacterized protein (TIGR00299 family) protein
MLAYLDCFSGISGDMTLGAMVDLGVPVEWLKQQLSRLPIDGFDLRERKVAPSGITATRIDVIVRESHHHRDFNHIVQMIEGSGLPERVKTRSLGVFGRIAAAEGTIHGVPKEKVHFHEVGSMDAIIDVVGACLAMAYLKIDRVVTGTLPLGRGFVTCSHGVLPVPAPATVEILKGAPVTQGEEGCELVTPTGAAIAMELSQAFGPLPAMTITRIGYGAGSRTLETRPNLLRVFLGESAEMTAAAGLETLVMVECCIDDMNPELFGYLMETLFSVGALDVYWVPVYMKKNRPGTMIQALCREADREAVIAAIFRESTSIGVRFHKVYRQALKRESSTVDTLLGPIAVKRVVGQDGSERVVPEFEDCRRVANDKGVPLQSVYEMVLKSSSTL